MDVIRPGASYPRLDSAFSFRRPDASASAPGGGWMKGPSPGCPSPRDRIHPRPSQTLTLLHPLSHPRLQTTVPLLGASRRQPKQPQHLRASKSCESITSRHARLPSAFLPRKPRKRSTPQLPSSVSCPTQELLRVVSTRYAISEYTCYLSREGLS